MDKYNIPSENVVGLTLPDEAIYDGHVVQLFRKAEVIKDTTSAFYDIPDTHAWEYYLDYVAGPLKNHLNSTIISGDSLKNIVRYILLTYGIPFRIQARHDWAGFLLTRQNIALDGLLSILYHPNILDLWNTDYDDADYWNPYWRSDRYYNFDMRFKPHHFVNDAGLILNYLVTRLDALDLETIEGMIDKSFAPDYTGIKTWIMDAGGPGSNDITAAKNELNYLDFTTEYNNTSQIWITTSDDPVIAYTSAGFHQGMPYTYIQDTLDFDYENGSIFNTYESFNGEGIRTLTRREGAYQGLLTEFFLTDGTAGACHTWEPTTHTVSHDSLWFPGYAMGYTVTDATFKGMEILAFQNVLVGDPLSAIAWGKQTLTQNLTWSGRNLVTGEITIPVLYTTLTIEDDAYIELRHQGFIPCTPAYGRLIVGQDVIFETDSWDRSLLLSYDSENARLVWADHPAFPALSYNVYRKFDNGNWSLIANVMGNEYTDDEVTFMCPECPVNATVHYKVTALSQLQESDYSNEVSADVLAKLHKETTDDETNRKVYTYSLSQNYPNPFNPSTTISYSIKEAGLVQLKVFDILGKEVTELVNKNQEPGNYNLTFDASNLPSGIYFYRLTSGNYSAIKKLILLK